MSIEEREVLERFSRIVVRTGLLDDECDEQVQTIFTEKRRVLCS